VRLYGLPAWRTTLPVVVLVSVAASQIVLVRTTTLTPWKGGGFGMFSTTDYAAHRSLRITVEGPDRSEEIAIAPSLADLAGRAASLPARRQLDRLARAVASRERRKGRSVESVRIECLRVVYESRTLGATEERICDVRVRDETAAAHRP
jgi:hypothetical protein